MSNLSPIPSHLIIVCGHAIWLGGPSAGHDESEWIIEDYKRGETPTFIQHIKAGVDMLNSDPNNSVLVFSGAPTSPKTTISEASSYHSLALANNFYCLEPNHHPPRVLLEERALDSYHNVLFSLVLFWKSFGAAAAAAAWPTRMTIVSHEFKRTRLVRGHCAAIGFPLDRVDYVGINPRMAEGKEGSMVDGSQLTLGQWEEDPHGVGEDLAGKRKQRNCWGVRQKLFESEEERERAGVDTRVMRDGDYEWEALIEGGRRPWSSPSNP